MPMLAAEMPIVAFDLETTGLELNSARVWEFAAVNSPRPGEVATALSVTINPIVPIPPKVIEATGLSPEKHARIMASPPFSRYAEEIAKLVTPFNANNPGILLTYNGEQYDIPLLENLFMRENRPTFISREYSIDALALIRAVYPNLPKKNLGYVAKHFGLDMLDAHAAASDCTMTINIFRHLLANTPNLPTDFDELRRAHRQIVTAQIEDVRRYGLFFRTDRKTGKLRFNIGGCIGQFLDDKPGAARWMLEKADCPAGARMAIEKALRR